MPDSRIARSAPVLVTGADGFVGRHLVQRLLSDGATVRALDLRFEADGSPQVDRIIGDVLNRDVMAKAMDGIVCVYHLAAISDLWVPPADPDRHHRVNVEGTQNVIDAAVAAGVRRLIYCSSNVVSIAGSRGILDIDEDHQPRRDALFGSYARSKFDAERRIAAAGDSLETVILRPGTPIGPGDHRPTPPGRLMRDLANGVIPALPARGFINFVDVRVLCDAMAGSRYLAPSGSRYLLTGCDVTFQDLARSLVDITGLAMARAWVPHGLAWMAALVDDRVVSRLSGRRPNASFDGVRIAGRDRRFSALRAKRDMDFADTDVSRALAESLDWMCRQGMINRTLPGLPAALQRLAF